MKQLSRLKDEIIYMYEILCQLYFSQSVENLQRLILSSILKLVSRRNGIPALKSKKK